MTTTSLYFSVPNQSLNKARFLFPTTSYYIDGSISDQLAKDDLLVYWEVSKFEEISAHCAIVCFRGDGNADIFKSRTCLTSTAVDDHKRPALSNLLKRFGRDCLSVRLFYRPSQTITSKNHVHLYIHNFSLRDKLCRTLQPFLVLERVRQ
jgi:hypothetical protein